MIAYKEMKLILVIIAIIFLPGNGNAVNKKEIDRLCRSTNNFTKCVNNFREGSRDRELNRTLYRSNGPIKIRVIPYQEEKYYNLDDDLDDY
tara:strand:- start:163 stop:435 length:273 start_codon:yes stop_codon:yes gene_type:complete